MKVVMPEVMFRKAAEDTRLAPRPQTLDGLRIGLFDGWGIQRQDGTVGVYPLMEAYVDRLRARFRLKEVVWQLKDKVSEPVPFETLDDYLRRVDVVINGEAA